MVGKSILKDLTSRIENSGIVSALDMIIKDQYYAGQSGEDALKESLKSMVKPYGLPLLGVGFVYFGTRWIVGKIATKVEGWRWYFKWPVKIITGLGGFILFLGGLELLTNTDYSDEAKYHERQGKRKDGVMKRVKKKQPEPSNTVESDGAGGLRRRFDDYKFQKIIGHDYDDMEAIYTTARHRDTMFPERVLSKPFIKYKRRSPHWEKFYTNKWRSNPFSKQIHVGIQYM